MKLNLTLAIILGVMGAIVSIPLTFLLVANVWMFCGVLVLFMAICFLLLGVFGRLVPTKSRDEEEEKWDRQNN